MQSAPPLPAAHTAFVPVSVTYPVLALGEEPRVVTETRHLVYTHFSYRKMAESLGVDMRAMSRQVRAMKKRGAELSRKHGPKKAEAMVAEEFAGTVQGTDVDLDDMQQVAVMIWAGLVTEDPDLTVDRVLSWLTAHNQRDLLLAAVKGIAYYLQGPDALAADYSMIEAQVSGFASVPDEAEGSDEGNG